MILQSKFSQQCCRIQVVTHEQSNRFPYQYNQTTSKREITKIGGVTIILIIIYLILEIHKPETVKQVLN